MLILSNTLSSVRDPVLKSYSDHWSSDFYIQEEPKTLQILRSPMHNIYLFSKQSLRFIDYFQIILISMNNIALSICYFQSMKFMSP